MAENKILIKIGIGSKKVGLLKDQITKKKPSILYKSGLDATSGIIETPTYCHLTDENVSLLKP